MNIGIAGGTGLVGRALALRLLEAGHAVRIFSRSSEVPIFFRNRKNLEIAGGDFPKPERLEGLDGIVNLAGAPIVGVRWTKKVKEEIRSSRVNYTENLVSSISKITGTPPKVFIQGSAIGYYGSFENETVDFSESSAPGTDDLASLCVDWETASEPLTKLGIRLVPIRIGIVLSPYGGALKKMLSPFRLGLGGPIGSGRQFFSWIHIEDMIGAIVYLLENPNLSGAFNLAAPNPVNNEVFSKTLAHILKRPAFFRVPATILKILYQEGAEVILKGQKVVPERLQKSGFTFLYPKLDAALRNLLASNPTDARVMDGP
ncbi:TIGR01777 family oxidoreductase [Leptospira santarosai]|uniref:TIGR01777 family oxidoreductase n=1 Tax=Leptospira santarosai TaxID=28183 RepID=UPI0002BD5864|nr:TIGR01777 family oxidoreductase [Leptospira santarosai]EMO86235.1 TIGR01777 family protein [Leptospira santarosai str. AIM]